MLFPKQNNHGEEIGKEKSFKKKEKESNTKEELYKEREWKEQHRQTNKVSTRVLPRYATVFLEMPSRDTYWC